MKILVLTLCIGIVSSHPNLHRLKRQATSSSSEASSSTTPEASESASTTTSTPVSSTTAAKSDAADRNPDFGIGAAAGFGGIGSSAGIGNFQADTRKNPFLPFGAFAGLNLGQGQRIGAGCSGLSCGFQLGDFVFATPQLLGFGENFGAKTGLRNDGQPGRFARSGTSSSSASASSSGSGASTSSGSGAFGSSGSGASASSFGGNGNYNGYFPYPFFPNPYFYNPFNYFPNYQPFQYPQQSFPSFGGNNPQQQQPFNFPQQSIGDFARFGNNGGSGGGATSSSFGSTNVNGNTAFNGVSTYTDPSGKTTTVYKQSGQPDIINARMPSPGSSSNGVYSASGINVDSNGKVTSYRAGGNLP